MRTEELTIQLEPELRRQLHEAAEHEGRSEVDLVRAALVRYLQDETDRMPRSIGMGEDGEIPASKGMTPEYEPAEATGPRALTKAGSDHSA